MTIYADSSFLVSVYLIDQHSPEAWRRMASRPAVYVTPLHRAEFSHATFLHAFWKKITSLEAGKVMTVFDRDCTRGVWLLSGFPEELFAKSTELARRYAPTLGVRTLDSLHVACALQLKPDRFWSFDERQAKLARAVGLDTSA